MSRLTKKIEEQLIHESPELRAKGLRPEVVWVHESRIAELEEAWRRQVEAICAGDEEADIMDWVEAVPIGRRTKAQRADYRFVAGRLRQTTTGSHRAGRR
jgi:hypothetical protein